MPIDISTRFAFHLDQPGDVLLQFEAAAIPEQHILRAETDLCEADHVARVAAQGDIGERIWLRVEGDCAISYSALVEVERLSPELAGLSQLPAHALPGTAVEYLFDSRCCPAARMQGFVQSEFAGLSGGRRVLAMQDWIADKVTYVPGASDPTTTSLDTFADRRGVCRDFAHLLIAFARASAIPARYVSCYAPGVSPPDFHAVAEVFLEDNNIPGGGAWYMVDSTRMADPQATVKIGVGRDAADVSFMTVFGMADFGEKVVEVRAQDA